MNIMQGNRNDQIRIDDAIVDGKGYILDEPYIARYFDLQSPSRIAYSLRCAGYEHNVDPQSFRYCELGCGRGMTAAILAAAHPGSEFVGLDLNPEHIAFAETIAAQSDLSNVSFVQSGIKEAMQQDWEQFDYITVHGVYSWVDGEIREQVFDFISKYLKNDGTAYVSYNSYPGWSAKEPLWRLLNTHIKSVKGGSIDKIKSGIGFLDHLVETKAPYFEQNPSAIEHLEYLKSEDLRYISHEFCNEQFAPIYPSEIFEHAGQHHLKFVAQAESCYNLPFENPSQVHREFIDEFENHEEREIWISMLRNDQFRTDLFCSTFPTKLKIEQSQLWDAVFTNLTPLENLEQVLEAGSNEIDLSTPLVAALVDASEPGTTSLRDLSLLPELRKHSPKSILETAQMLELSGYFGFLVEPSDENELPFEAYWTFTSKASKVLIEAQIKDEAAPYVVAPKLGSAIRLETLDALALTSIDANDEETSIAQFMARLNDEHPGILSFNISKDWARNYLLDLRTSWGPVLNKLGIMVGMNEIDG